MVGGASWNLPYRLARTPVLAEGTACASQPLAAQTNLQALKTRRRPAARKSIHICDPLQRAWLSRQPNHCMPTGGTSVDLPGNRDSRTSFRGRTRTEDLRLGSGQMILKASTENHIETNNPRLDRQAAGA